MSALKGLGLLLCLCFVACTSSTSTEEQPNNSSTTAANDSTEYVEGTQDSIVKWKRMQGQGYSILYPATWEVEQSDKTGPLFIMNAPQTSFSDPLRENVNLIIQNAKGQNLTLDQLIAYSEQQIKQMMLDADILESSRKEAHGRTFHQILYTGKRGEMDIKLKILQYYWVEYEKVIVLTFTSEESQFEAYKEVSQKIMDSFKIGE